MSSGYTDCACDGCFDVSISADVLKPELCLLCKGAGCVNGWSDPNDFTFNPCEREPTEELDQLNRQADQQETATMEYRESGRSITYTVPKGD